MDKGEQLLTILKEIRKEKAAMAETRENRPPLLRETEKGLEKRCPKCRTYLPADQDHFYRDGRSKHKLTSHCIACQSGKTWEEIRSGRKGQVPAEPGNGPAGPCAMTLDFSGDQELLEQVLEAARKKRRQPDQQVLWILEQHLVSQA